MIWLLETCQDLGVVLLSQSALFFNFTNSRKRSFKAATLRKSIIQAQSSENGHEAWKQASGRGWCHPPCLWFYVALKAFLNLHASSSPIHKNDNNHTCRLCTSKDRGRTNERSVRGFELSGTKLLWPHKVQRGVLRLGFSWRLAPALEFFAHHWLLVGSWPESPSREVSGRRCLHSRLGRHFHWGHCIWNFCSCGPVPCAC